MPNMLDEIHSLSLMKEDTQNRPTISTGTVAHTSCLLQLA